MRESILVSACLLGLPTRYNGTTKRNQKVLDWLAREGLTPVPVCPEQLAGLPTPRDKTRFLSGDGRTVIAGGGNVATFAGESLNEPFLRGARVTLHIARLAGCRRALLKERSPSCGVHRIHRGDQLVEGVGVATALLLEAGISVFSEDDLPAAG